MLEIMEGGMPRIPGIEHQLDLMQQLQGCMYYAEKNGGLFGLSEFRLNQLIHHGFITPEAFTEEMSCRGLVYNFETQSIPVLES